MIHGTQSAQISQKQDECNICVIMKTMCPPGYLGGNSCTWAHDVPFMSCMSRECMSCHKANVAITGRAHCFHDYIYIYIYIYIHTHTHTHIYIYIYMETKTWSCSVSS